MGLWDKVTSWFKEDGVHYISHAVPKANVDVAYNADDIVSGRAYLRVWLVDMFLAQSRDWFQDWQPAVQGRVKLMFADQSVEVMRLAAPSGEKFKTGKAVVSNYVLLNFVPFNGGLLEVEAALLALKGKDRLATAINIVAEFADLVVPPLGKTLEVATKVKAGITALFSDADEVHLASHNTLGGAGGANKLIPGYVAVIRATDAQVDRTKLCVKGDKLCTGDLANATPLRGFDYMLLRFETAPTRDDFEYFSDISQLRGEAIKAYLNQEPAKGDALIASAMARIATHPDLINADRRALAKLVKDEVAEYKDTGLGATGAAPREWNEVVKMFKPVADHSDVTFNELL